MRKNAPIKIKIHVIDNIYKKKEEIKKRELKKIQRSPQAVPRKTKAVPFKKSLQTLINIYSIYKHFYVTSFVLFVKFV